MNSIVHRHIEEGHYDHTPSTHLWNTELLKQLFMVSLDPTWSHHAQVISLGILTVTNSRETLSKTRNISPGYPIRVRREL